MLLKIRGKHGIRLYYRKDRTNNQALITELKNAQNLSNLVTNSARAAFESRIIQNCKVNPKSFSSYVKSKTKNPDDISSRIINNTVIYDDLEKAVT